MKKLIRIEFYILLAGTIFAWVNFGIELNDWLHKRACSTGCSVGLVNPFLTPCFYGAICFLIAFIVAALLLRMAKPLEK